MLKEGTKCLKEVPWVPKRVPMLGGVPERCPCYRSSMPDRDCSKKLKNDVYWTIYGSYFLIGYRYMIAPSFVVIIIK